MIYHLPLFSEKPAFKVSSSWTPPIRNVQLELYLTEIEDKLININESGKKLCESVQG